MVEDTKQSVPDVSPHKESAATKPAENKKAATSEIGKTEKSVVKPETKQPAGVKSDPKIDPDQIKPGMTVRVHQKIRDVNAKGEEKERIQIFEGIILAKRGKRLDEARILVRKISANNIGVEKLFPLVSPTIVKVEVVRETKVRRAKLYFLRDYKKRLREKKSA